MKHSEKHPSPPFMEILKTIPDIIGIRLNEQPEYSVLKHDGDFEIRRYPKFMLAQVAEVGPRELALKHGFQRLADYIFGENTKDLHDEEPHPEKMAMTAPVFHEEKDGKWLISFIVPSKYDLNSIPRPQDSNIEISEKGPKTVAVITYSGNNTEENMYEHEDKLQVWLTENNIKMTSDFYFAQYDPPFAVPVFKRNEVFVKVDFTEQA